FSESDIEAVAPIGGLVLHPLRSRHETALARAHAVLVNDVDLGIKSNFTQFDHQLARTGLDIDRLSDAFETRRRHVDLMRAQRQLVSLDRRLPDELAIDEDLSARHVALNRQKAYCCRGRKSWNDRRRFRSGGWTATRRTLGCRCGGRRALRLRNRSRR